MKTACESDVYKWCNASLCVAVTALGLLSLQTQAAGGRLSVSNPRSLPWLRLDHERDCPGAGMHGFNRL